MNRGAILVTGAALLAIGCAQTGELAIRARPTGLAAGEQPARFRVAEARSHFALGNVALALEGFRKALREDTGSVDAMNGIAACYDRMGRFDLSRRYYEMALAVAPDDPRLYANLALSLQLQGRGDEATKVRTELASRKAAGRVALASASAEVGAALSVPLPDPVTGLDSTSAPSSTRPATAVSVALPLPAPAPRGPSNARLERLSLGEVALVTSGPLHWKPLTPERSVKALAEAPPRRSPAIAVTLLNAARSEGLAARARAMLQNSGFGRPAIGNAAQVRRSSVIAYPAWRRAEALQLAERFGVAFRHQTSVDDRVVIYLGRDAATALRSRQN